MYESEAFICNASKGEAIVNYCEPLITHQMKVSGLPKGIAGEIKKHIPDFIIDYKVDSARQAIAESWPNNMDDSAARKEWGWNPEYNLESMTRDMIEKLTVKLRKGSN